METQMMKLTKGSVKTDSLPIDLMMEILKRLPVKTLIRFMSVSKLWASTIRSRDFMKLFMDVSLTRPKGLLFLFGRSGCCGLVLSQNTHESSLVTIFRVSCYSPQWSTVSPSVHGLICYAQATRLVIYNPCTRRSITLPEINTWRTRPIRYYLGYDPIENGYKVLCAMLGAGVHDLVKEFRVLTVGTESSWKMIKNNIISHAPFGRELCISGILYYQAFTGRKKDLTIMSFDVRSEKLYPIKGPNTLMCSKSSKLISYEGKLGVIFYIENGVSLCVLEDAAKEEWSTKTFVLSTAVPPINWNGKCTETDTGEIILAPLLLRTSVVNLVYYDMKTMSENTVYIRGNTQGNTESIKGYHECCYFVESVSSNLVENLMFL
ncbi:unnamed protein product [Brassica rapa subsp. narinosa]